MGNTDGGCGSPGWGLEAGAAGGDPLPCLAALPCHSALLIIGRPRIVLCRWGQTGCRSPGLQTPTPPPPYFPVNLFCQLEAPRRGARCGAVCVKGFRPARLDAVQKSFATLSPPQPPAGKLVSSTWAARRKHAERDAGRGTIAIVPGCASEARSPRHRDGRRVERGGLKIYVFRDSSRLSKRSVCFVGPFLKKNSV